MQSELMFTSAVQSVIFVVRVAALIEERANAIRLAQVDMI